MCFKIKKAEPRSRKLLLHSYSKDANAEYYGFHAISGADPLTFEGIAKDHHCSYAQGVLQKS
jgi:hypothetical protein